MGKFALLAFAVLLPTLVGGAILAAVRGYRRLSRLRQTGPLPPEPIDRVAARLRRLRAGLEEIENQPGGTAKRHHILALRGAYLDTLSSACQRFGVSPAWRRPGPAVGDLPGRSGPPGARAGCPRSGSALNAPCRRVEAWGFRCMQVERQYLDRDQIARRWFTEEFTPVVRMLRAADLVGSGTDAEAYMRVASQRYGLMRTHEWNDEVIERLRQRNPGSPAGEGQMTPFPCRPVRARRPLPVRCS